ncbi:MAG: glycoside hydrolase TIM-barrel-like domain-containing protein [Cytophagales bacterium]|nr:glycoside hydrolase TIM-barrel-like domain-containing protein [Cytophagales bacterium]
MKSQTSNQRNVLYGLLLSLLTVACSLEQRSAESNPKVEVSLKDKQRGAHVFGRMDSTDFQFLAKDHVEWVTLVPYGYQEGIASSEVFHHRGDSARMQRRNERWLQQIKSTREAGYKVFVKPHIWMRTSADGKWRSDIYPADDESWEQWKLTYRHFILRYARLAEAAGAEMFCVGAELTRLTLEKPEYWRELITEVRTVFSGKLTYAANWYREFEGITFWDQLDYVGVQAYFPLCDHENPDVAKIAEGWKRHIPALEKIHLKSGRPVLFTELGYKSTPNSAQKPWEWMEYENMDEMKVSFETQSNCYRAFFQTIWPKHWFAGVHLWQYRSDFEALTKDLQFDFTPQGKPAEEVIKEGFKRK